MLLLLPHDEHSVEVRGGNGRGSAMVRRVGDRLYYTSSTGDPLGLGDVTGVSEHEAWERSMQTDYPDALVQILALNDCRRSGDLILSATREWDYRGRYEPIPHRSSHGALHREHMLVPMLTNVSSGAPWRRTQDVFHRAMLHLGV